MLKIGLIGAGMMGRAHAEAYASVRGARLVGIADECAEAAGRLAERAGVPHYGSMEELIRGERPDAVDLCLPTELHREYTVRAAESGLHVLCEKPIALTLEDAGRMIEACRKAGVVLMVGHALRFSPDYRMAKAMAAEGKLGKIGTVRMIRESAMPGWGAWFADRSRSGGVLLDLAVHDLDWLRWTFGEARRVYAKSASAAQGLPRGEHAFVSIRMKSGVIAHLTGSWAQPDGFRSYLEMAGTGGVATLDSDGAQPIRIALRAEEGGRAAHFSESPLASDAYAAELQHFVDCIETGTEPLVNGEEAALTLELALAAIRSADSGQVVHFD
ncbi:Gfo/Idh/MocA family protein [Paenibacillaceae bacterium WGS1546]|uniref:Gfo/Idh/MocA family protein n=1 Tax=Cohnella sp. WGS1546 TaxID=3366810 RepID=UPI00372D5192